MIVQNQGRSQNRSASRLAVAVLLAGALALPLAPRARADDAPRTSSSSQSQLDLAMGFSEAFERVAAEVSPSVVSITATYGPEQPRIQPRAQRGQPRQQPQQQIDPNEMMRRFFGDQFPPQFGEQPGQQRRGQSFGSGVIATADGYILTNNHVVENADRIQVRLSNDATYDAKVIGTDPDTDTAVIKIEATDLRPVKFGDLARVKPGQWVLAIGSPFNLSQTVTAGIVSSVGRGGVNLTRYDNFIQTDAAINPGNSGGPLVNLQGEMIGINSAIFSRSGGSIGIGFAIPINMARNTMDSLIATGKAQRGGFLGVKMQDLEEATAKSLAFNGTDGVLVTEVGDDSPAAAAGIKVEDIITSIDGLPVHDPGSLATVVRRLSPGRTVPVALVREGKPMTLQVTLGQSNTKEVAKEIAPEGKLDITVRENNAEELARLGVKMQKITGVVIADLGPKSVLKEWGVQPGDLLLSINGQPVGSTEDFAKIEEKLELGKPVRVRIVSTGGVTRVLTFPLGS